MHGTWAWCTVAQKPVRTEGYKKGTRFKCGANILKPYRERGQAGRQTFKGPTLAFDLLYQRCVTGLFNSFTKMICKDRGKSAALIEQNVKRELVAKTKLPPCTGPSFYWPQSCQAATGLILPSSLTLGNPPPACTCTQGSREQWGPTTKSPTITSTRSGSSTSRHGSTSRLAKSAGGKVGGRRTRRGHRCTQQQPVMHAAAGVTSRAEKAKAVFPRPTGGVLKPVVRGQTVKYNLKQRLGRGFTLEELKVRGCREGMP
eukprot:1140680-Pelagomonas_calceolata.AAC.2